ncbi:DMT family transporter [Sulfuriferula nivalis]|uniref:Membrane protein n=1 Tax=Sulfuriferula nivalis TaxID=2675298 RepID=A0A809S7I5_9PROT|nr:DMT family transporter [Sulfuriferula nivalis]BBO99802.1 membrane protein [Sulfuriferula nivalis]
MIKNNTIYLLVIIATLFWGANFALAGPILQEMSPLWLAASRFGLSAMLMMVFASWRREPLLAPAMQHIKAYLIIAAVGIGGFNLLFFYALQTTSAGNASLIMATNPLVTIVLAALVLGERPSKRLLLSLPLALVGVLVVISSGDMSKLTHLQNIQGDVLMLGGNLAWAGYNVLSRKLMPKQSALTNTTLVMSAGALILLAAAALSGDHLTTLGFYPSVDLAIMVVGGTVLAYLFWNTGIARFGAGRTALFMNLIPVFAMLTAAVMGQLPNLAQIMGGGLVISGVALAMMPLRRRPEVDEG